VVFDGVRANPRTEDVDTAAAQAREMGVDFIVGLGGGSAIDTAKCIALAAANEGPFWESMMDSAWTKSSALPLIAIPTTSGTGTEGNCVAVMCGPEGKRGFVHPGFAPTLALVDPELSQSCPQRLTALTGMDAFFHAAECFLSTARQPMTDMLCLEAVSLITRFLPTAVEDGTDLNARTAMAWASTAAGMCLTLASPISQHALEYSFSGSNPNSPHGGGLVLLSRSYFAKLIELTQDEETEERLLNLAVAMGFGLEEDPERHPFIEALDALLEAVGLADLHPQELGFEQGQVEDFTSAAMQLAGSRQFLNTPVKMSEADVRAIFSGVFTQG
jgi:alcohol dehydrogenase